MNDRFYQALCCAIKAYDGQYDNNGAHYYDRSDALYYGKNGVPYILHPLHVSTLVETEEDKIVALFHDIVECTEYTLDDIEAWGFGDLKDAVDCITQRKNIESYAEYIERVCSNPISLKVKIAYMRHYSDLSQLNTITEKDKKMHEKYCQWLPILESRLALHNL